MREKDTRDLGQVLEGTPLEGFAHYLQENRESLSEDSEAFSIYIKGLLARKGITQQAVFLKADIPERYGYKLLSGEKRTRQRDILLRICYASELTLEETQSALEKYEMPALYPKRPRDALLMLIFRERPGSILDVNALLKKHGMEPLRTSGLQD